MSAEQTEPFQLLARIHELKALLDAPTNMTAKKLKDERANAHRLETRCWYYAGWHAGQSTPDPSRRVAHSTIDELDAALAQAKRFKKRDRAGRPPVATTSFTMALLVLPTVDAAPKGKKARVIDEFAAKGTLDKTVKTKTLAKRLERASARIRKKP